MKKSIQQSKFYCVSKSIVLLLTCCTFSQCLPLMVTHEKSRELDWYDDYKNQDVYRLEMKYTSTEYQNLLIWKIPSYQVIVTLFANDLEPDQIYGKINVRTGIERGGLRDDAFLRVNGHTVPFLIHESDAQEFVVEETQMNENGSSVSTEEFKNLVGYFELDRGSLIPGPILSLSFRFYSHEDPITIEIDKRKELKEVNSFFEKLL